MQARMKLGDYLVSYLKKIGVSHLFGIPGDLVINLFLKFGRPQGMKIITLSHEPGVGFAADGYARSTGRIGVICVTYGAGGHNMVNPVAGSFSERPGFLCLDGFCRPRSNRSTNRHGNQTLGAQWRWRVPDDGSGDRSCAAVQA